MSTATDLDTLMLQNRIAVNIVAAPGDSTDINPLIHIMALKRQTRTCPRTFDDNYLMFMTTHWQVAKNKGVINIRVDLEKVWRGKKAI